MSGEQCLRSLCSSGVLNVAVDVHRSCVLNLAASCPSCTWQLLPENNVRLLTQLGPAEQSCFLC